MARLCSDCGVLCVEDWQYLCDLCETARLLFLCNCEHDERDQCICYDACPHFDSCPGWQAPLFAEVFGPAPEASPVSSSGVNPPEGRAERAEG